jgi:hypothetical protein
MRKRIARISGYLVVVVAGCFLAVEPDLFFMLHLGAIAVFLLSLGHRRWRTCLREQFGLSWAHPAVLVAILIVAYALPAGELERTRIGPLPATQVTLGSLPRNSKIDCDAGVINVSILLPSTSPTLREVVRAAEATGRVKCRVDYCGNGGTILGGYYIMRIRVTQTPAP